VPKTRLTDLAVRSLPEGLYLDERTPSFGIRVGKNRKTWIVIKGPSRTKVRLGYYPELSLADARKKAFISLGSPLEPASASAPPFPEARERYLAQGKWKAMTRKETTRTLTKHFSWTKTIDKITHHDVTESIEAIKKPSEATHTFRDLRGFFNWCVPRYIKHSPCAGLKPPARYVPRERFLSDDELMKVWEALGDDAYSVVIKLLILTGQRLGETAAIQRKWLDGTILTFPAAVTKNGREHRIPLPSLATPLISQVRSFTGWGKAKARLDERCGVTGFTHHDLRRTYAANLQKLGVRLEVTEALLNHISGTRAGIVGVYQRHDYMGEMRQAVDAWEAWFTALLSRP
jgi:integrase